MLTIKNGYDDREVTIVARELRTGNDGEAVTLQPGESGEVEVDGDNQVSISTRGRQPGEPALTQAPDARLISGEDSVTAAAAEGPKLTEAGDDVVRAEIATMIGEKANLTQSGLPELPTLNERLAAKGFGPVDTARRKDLMPAA